MKKIGLWSALVLVVVGLGVTAWFLSAGHSMERHLEQRLGISLPEGTNIASTDDHGGFHGDGTLIAVVTVLDKAGQEELQNQVEDKWSAFPVDAAVLEPVRRHWEERSGVLPDLPDAESGWWFYRDRYQEQYGEACAFNPVLQNCTFALLDRNSWRLYVLENDC